MTKLGRVVKTATLCSTFALRIYCQSAGASISGTVLDPQSRAVPRAQVTLFSANGEAGLATETDSAGRYFFTGLTPASYLLEAKAPGFASYHEQNVNLADGEQLKIDLGLSLGAVAEQVSVTASNTPQPGDQISKALNIIDNDSIQQRQDYSLVDALRLTPGINIQQLGGPGALSEIRIRGLRPEDTAVLVDGMRLRDASATQADASSLLEDFLLPDENRIEVLRGSGSSLYGTDAIGGVVNVITGQGGGPTHGSLQIEGGGLGLLRGSASLAGGARDDKVQYSAGIMHLNVMSGVGGDAPARISSAQGHVSVRLFPGLQVVARFYGSDSFSKLSADPQAIADYPSGIVPAIPLRDVALAEFQAGVPLSNIATGNATYVPSIDDPDYTRSARFETGALRILGQPTAKLGYTADYQIVNSARRYGNGPAGTGFQPQDNTRSDYNGRIHTLSARVTYQPATWNLITGGYEYEHENYNSYSSETATALSNSFVNANQASNTAFVQDQARLFSDRLYLSAAFRAQSFGLQQPAFAPAASAPYQNLRLSAPSAAFTGDGSAAYYMKRSRTKIRAHVGRGYRQPSLYERFGAGYDTFFGYSVYGDPLLKPEQSIAVDAGVDQSFFGNKINISTTYFYTHLQRVIAFDFSGLLNPSTDPFGRAIGYLNTRGGFARGVEFHGDWTATQSLTFSGSYTYTDARERTPLVANVYRSFITPQNQFTLFAVQRIGRRLLVNLALNASDSYLGEVYSSFTSGAFRFPGHKRVDAGISYRIPLNESRAMRLFVKVENMVDQTYYQSGFATPGVTGRGGLQFEF